MEQSHPICIRMAFICFLLVILTSVVFSEDVDVIVSTRLGKISGFKEQSTNGNSFYSFHAVPYAQPPIGSLRFKDPLPVKEWTGIRNGSEMPPTCPQIPFIEAIEGTPKYIGEEDCLFLSIFTSKPGEVDGNLPVMVFIHGGGFFSGGIDWYAPYALMNEEIILVVMQYRLGILGFLSTDDDVIPGNFGLKDQVLALRWIQENIHSFGGDKSRVTIFGESAGGASVHFHVLSPYSNGLFANAIMQSGTLFCPWGMGGAFREVAMHTGKRFDCPNIDSLNNETNAKFLECLQGADVVNLTLGLDDHFHWICLPILMAPRVDGDYLPEEPQILMKEGKYNKVNIISGINSHEGALATLPLYSMESSRNDLLKNFKEIGPTSLDLREGDSMPAELAQRIFDYYVGGVKANMEDADNLCDMFGDWHFKIGHDLVAELHVQTHPDVPIYLYELNHRGQRSFGDFFDADVGEHWVNHGDELYYLFTGEMTPWSPLEREDDLKLRDIILKLWYNFAATGDPTPNDSLGFTWNAASKDYFDHLSLTPSPSMENDKREKVRQLLKSLPTKQNYILHPDSVSKEQLQPLREGNDGVQNINSPRKYIGKDEL